MIIQITCQGRRTPSLLNYNSVVEINDGTGITNNAEGENCSQKNQDGAEFTRQEDNSLPGVYPLESLEQVAHGEQNKASQDDNQGDGGFFSGSMKDDTDDNEDDACPERDLLWWLKFHFNLLFISFYTLNLIRV